MRLVCRKCNFRNNCQILSHPNFERVDDQSVVAGNEGEKYDRIVAMRGYDYLMVYNGREFAVQTGKISGEKVSTWCYNTGQGEAT